MTLVETSSPTSNHLKIPAKEPVARFLKTADIVESKTNPRKTFLEVKELAEDIKIHGVLEPVLVRPHPSGDGYELVFGARRFRGAKLAGLDEIPGMVRELSDEKVLEIQVVENSKRVDIHPLEEADGYAMMHDRYKFTQEEIAAKVGKSVATIAQRLRFTTLIKIARDAFLSDKLTAATALLIARLPQEVQADALKAITAYDQWSEGVPSAKRAASIIEEEFTLTLSSATFDKKSLTLVPDAGACTTCPKRSKNQTLLFVDEKSKDTCLDLKCFKSKVDADWNQKKIEAEKNQRTVLEGDKAKNAIGYGSGFVQLDREDSSDKKSRTWREKIGKREVPIVLARDREGTPVELVRETDLKKAGVIKAVSTGSSFDSRERKRREQTKEENAKKRAALAMLTVRAAAMGTAEEEFELARAIARGVVRVSSIDTAKAACACRDITPKQSYASREALVALVPKLTLGELRGLVVELLASEEASRKEFTKLLGDA